MNSNRTITLWRRGKDEERDREPRAKWKVSGMAARRRDTTKRRRAIREVGRTT